MDAEEHVCRLMAPTADELAAVKVYPLIPALKKDVITTIDSPLSWDQLTASDINFSVVRPLVFKYARLQNISIIYACLVVRSYSLKQAEEDLAYSGVNLSRAMLCEIVAMKLLSTFASDYIQLVAVLTTSWNPLAGASQDVIDEVRQIVGGDPNDVMNYPQNALEMAISTRSKNLVSSPITQKVVNDIYSGRVVFSTLATRSVLADNYKPRPIDIYDSRTAPFLNHYRLRVPKYGAILEFLSFALLFFAYVMCLFNEDASTITPWEYLFILVAAAFTLEEYTASMEHGWTIYIANMWNVFDTAFIILFLVYLGFRIDGLANENVLASNTAFDILSCGACILFPRLAFFAVSNTVVVLSLRAMIAEFVFFIGIAAICFSGLLFTLWTLGKDTWSLRSIAWLMVQIWFGNTSLSFGQARSFHPIMGPILMTGYAAMSNTLLLTILISMLSNTVARIDSNATQEHLFQVAITTIEGVQADALFSYQPPFNILAFVILKPASYTLSPRRLHSLNVFLIKLTNLPFLVIIGIYERHAQFLRQTSGEAMQTVFHSLPRHLKQMPLIEALVGSSSADLYDAIFDVEEETGVEGEHDVFGADEEPLLRSSHSRENVRTRMVSPVRRSGRKRAPASPLRPPQLDISSADFAEVPPSPVRSRTPSAAAYMSNAPASPLARLFSGKASAEKQDAAAQAVEAGAKKMERLVDDLKDLPLRRLEDEMKDLQDRQARIESLLLTLTRGMRNETGGLPRQDTLQSL